MTLIEQLKEAIRTCGKTRRSICHAANIGEEVLRRFMAGRVGMNLTTAGRITDFLGLSLTSTATKPETAAQ